MLFKKYLIAFVILFLSSCGWTPVYYSADSEPVIENQKIDVLPIPDETGRFLKSKLEDLFNPQKQDIKKEYTLQIVLTERIDSDQGILGDNTATRATMRIDAQIILKQKEKVLLNTYTFAVSSYNILMLPYPTVTTEDATRHRLLETLDKRVLENMLHHDAGAFRKNFSLNIAIKTILSPDFQSFNESIDPLCRKSILLEVKQHDIFSNLSAFLAARSFIAEQGYRLCVDMVSADSLSLLNREKLGADFIKLVWNEDLLNMKENATFISNIKTNDPKHIILCHVDDKRAIEWGQSLGLSLFQGYFIQKMLYQTPKKSAK